MKKLKKLIFNLTSLTIITGFIFIVSATSAFAHYYQNGYSLYKIPYTAENGSWYFQEAAKNWQNAVGTNIYETGSSNKARLVSLTYNWFGLYSPQIIGGTVTSFIIQVNSRSLGAHPDYGSGGYPKWEAVVSVATHEFGHAQFLSDLEGWGNSSIMSKNRDRNKILTPQAHDITDIRNMR